MYNDFKIALSGSQGAGKTTLAYALSNKHNIPLSKSNTREIMSIFGFENHKQIMKAAVNTPEVGIEFQKTLASEKLKEFNESEKGFISDRSLIDIFTYYSLHNSAFANEKVNEQMKNMLMESFHSVDLTVFLSPRLSKIEDNQIRVNSSVYYETVSSVMYSTLCSSISAIDFIHKLTCDSYSIKNSKIKTHFWHNKNTAILHLDESECIGGIASVSQRVEALEMILNDLMYIRGYNLCY